MIKGITIENDGEPITVWSTLAGKYVRLDSINHTMRIDPKSIDELIEALQQIKKEINNV